MNFRGRPVSHLPARGFIAAAHWCDRAATSVRKRLPEWFGLPVLGPYVQLYRHDAMFDTEVSFFNYLSTFIPGIEHHIDYRVSCLDRQGRKLGSGVISVGPGASAQVPLREIVARNLDAYGLFHVIAKPRSNDVKFVASIGETTGQFMTLFTPVGHAMAAPQIVHSHKAFQHIPIFWSPMTRSPHVSEDVSQVQELEFYVLNPQALRMTFGLTVRDCSSAEVLLQRVVQVPGHGVGVVHLDQQRLSKLSDPICFDYDFDRQVSHRKPILFRRYPDGVVTCNHT